MSEGNITREESEELRKLINIANDVLITWMQRAIEAEALAAEMKGELDKLTQELYDSKYLAASRLKLLEEVKQLLDDIYAEDIISSGDLGKVYEKVAKELGDD